jgi:ech hydrogenase subunit F
MVWMLPPILRNLVSRPATRLYPLAPARELPPGVKGKIRFDLDKCDHCGDCERVCPSNAIQIQLEAKQTTYSTFNCIYCGACVEACLQNAISQDTAYAPPATSLEPEVIPWR